MENTDTIKASNFCAIMKVMLISKKVKRSHDAPHGTDANQL